MNFLNKYFKIFQKYYANEFHLKIFPDKKVELVYTDTDSGVYSVQTEDIYADFARSPGYFDFSNYPTSHPLYRDNPYLQENTKKVIYTYKYA